MSAFFVHAFAEGCAPAREELDIRAPVVAVDIQGIDAFLLVVAAEVPGQHVGAALGHVAASATGIAMTRARRFQLGDWNRAQEIAHVAGGHTAHARTGIVHVGIVGCPHRSGQAVTAGIRRRHDAGITQSFDRTGGDQRNCRLRRKPVERAPGFLDRCARVLVGDPGSRDQGNRNTIPHRGVQLAGRRSARRGVEQAQQGANLGRDREFIVADLGQLWPAARQPPPVPRGSAASRQRSAACPPPPARPVSCCPP